MKKTVTNEQGKTWLKKETHPYNTSILFLTGLSVLATVFSILFAYTVRYLINSASAENEKLLWIFACVLMGLLLLKILLKTLEYYFAERLRATMTAKLRTKLFSKILRSDYSKTQAFHSGEFLTRLTTDIQEVSAYTVNLPPVMAGMVIQFIGAIVALLTIDPLFTLVYIVAGSLFAGLAALFRKQLKKRQKEVLETDGEFRSYMQENLSSLMTLKAYGAEERSEEKADWLADNYYRARMRRNRFHSLMNGLFSLLSNFGLILAVVWCSISVLNGNRDYGSILSSILLLMQLQTPLSSFSSIPPAYYARITSGERLSEIDSLPCEATTYDWVDHKRIYERLRSLRFDNVSFTYGREGVFDNANAEIKKGEIVCLTGASGAGKSTVFKLLLNVFLPTDGKLIAEGDFEGGERLITSKDRVLFAYVPQGNFLFSGTIYENLAFFCPEPKKDILTEKIHDALKTACADFVFELPQGVETVLTERGGGLSEGQLQRLAVARALLSGRPILLLDEATSALDSDTEKALLKNIKELKNKTCIIVTHRPEALKIADKILRIENGKIERLSE